MFVPPQNLLSNFLFISGAPDVADKILRRKIIEIFWGLQFLYLKMADGKQTNPVMRQNYTQNALNMIVRSHWYRKSGMWIGLRFLKIKKTFLMKGDSYKLTIWTPKNVCFLKLAL